MSDFGGNIDQSLDYISSFFAYRSWDSVPWNPREQIDWVFVPFDHPVFIDGNLKRGSSRIGLMIERWAKGIGYSNEIYETKIEGQPYIVFKTQKQAIEFKDWVATWVKNFPCYTAEDMQEYNRPFLTAREWYILVGDYQDHKYAIEHSLGGDYGSWCSNQLAELWFWTQDLEGRVGYWDGTLYFEHECDLFAFKMTFEEHECDKLKDSEL